MWCQNDGDEDLLDFLVDLRTHVMEVCQTNQNKQDATLLKAFPGPVNKKLRTKLRGMIQEGTLYTSSGVLYYVGADKKAK